MTQLVTVDICPDSPPRVGECSLTFGELESWSRVTVSFAGMADPADYLRDMAAKCLGLAHLIERRAAERRAKA